ncbi:MAG TPA: hypothetical protein VFL55_24100, partial [Acetobacteraceae bacterium]|nr:hypothetical protein [Acetobacteraceae bacterium]
IRHYLSMRDQGVVIRNYQVVHLSSASIRSSHIQLACATGRDLVEVKALLASWRVFGIVRRFADSCRLLSAHYCPLFPDLRLRAIRENVSTDAEVSDREALERSRIELGPDTFDRLMAANCLDLELYDYAQRLFADAFARVPGLSMAPSLHVDHLSAN